MVALPAWRSARLSPMQMMAFKPARQAACALAATWALAFAVILAALGMSHDHMGRPASFSISAEMSPVKAPLGLGMTILSAQRERRL
jgi:hypothetical protein